MGVLKTEGGLSVLSVRTETYLPHHCHSRLLLAGIHLGLFQIVPRPRPAGMTEVNGHSRLLLAGIHLWFSFGWIPANDWRG